MFVLVVFGASNGSVLRVAKWAALLSGLATVGKRDFDDVTCVDHFPHKASPQRAV
jgi:hypothetical protein